MATKDKRIDEYIAKSADFAKPILNHLRKLIHKACPDVNETMKWSFPHFEYKGVICFMSSFKNHCAFGFWKASLMKDTDGFLRGNKSGAMGNFGKITSKSSLPKDSAIIGYIKEAVKLNEDGVKVKTPTKKFEKKELVVPKYFKDALSQNKKAKSTFEKFSPTNKREYVEWVTESKTDETRKKRLETAIEWMSEGKIRNWKYVRK